MLCDVMCQKETLRHSDAKYREELCGRRCVVGNYNCAISQELIDLGNRIRDRRMEKNMSQETVAEIDCISANTVSRIEGGRSAMSIGIFIRLVQILDMDANELLGVNLLETEKRDLGLAFRLQNLKKEEQTVVTRTMGALMEALQQYGS